MVEGRKIGAIIQARYDSTRLPGKVLMELPLGSGITILGHIVNRLQNIKKIDTIMLATSNEENDLPIVAEGEELGVEVFRGSKNDVLQRFVDASAKYKLDEVLRLTGDNPLVLNELLEEGIDKHVSKKADYSRNTGLPYGTSFEIVRSEALQKIAKSNPGEDEKEHVTLFVRNHPEQFQILEIDHSEAMNLDRLRLTVDYPTDYALMNIVMMILKESQFSYTLRDILNIFKENPWLHAVNENNIQKKQYQNFEEEYDDVMEVLNKLSFKHSVEKLKKQSQS